VKSSLNFHTLPLTHKKDGELIVPNRSGLNWGQRPGRNHDQAYLSIPSYVQRSGFFPEPGVEFLIICDDGFRMLCVRAQAKGKALHSKENNSILGLYFRERLGLKSGQLINIHHLYKYGRLSVDISKTSELAYTLDFSKK
jgi:hypothetical protein